MIISGNILYLQGPDQDDWHLIPIDFEYASYSYRSVCYTKLLSNRFKFVKMKQTSYTGS